MAEMVTTNTLISINKEKFTWIPFYKEFAQKLLQFSSDRSGLLKIIYSNRAELLANYLHDNGGVESTEKVKPTFRLKVNNGEIVVLPFFFCLS